jgi:uncharacterized protein YggE
MEKSVKITSIIAGTIILLALIEVLMFNQLLPGQIISVQGNSVIKVTPDLVSVYFNAETNGTTAKEAKDANALIVDNLITALIKQGFERADITTENLNIYEDTRWENGRYKSYGYKASHQIKVELSTNQADKIGDVIDAGVDAGALLSYINFELSNDKQNEYKTQALREAGQDAQAKAEAIAEGVDKRLGSLVSISTTNWGYSPWNVYSASYGGMAEDAIMAKTATTNVQPGTQEVTANIDVTYKLR